MAIYSYITKAQTPKTFQAADEASAMKLLGGFADRDPNSGIQRIDAPQPTSLGAALTPPKAGLTPAPALPEPSKATPDYLQTAAESQDTSRKAVEDAYKNRINTIDSQKQEAERKMAEYEKKQTGEVLPQMEDLTKPYRATLEATERERLHINENFEKNQKLTNELDSLLTESSLLIDKLSNQKVPGLAGLQQSPRVLRRMSDVTARTGVIQAVMAARNNQISQAYTLIDRAAGAIQEDRQGQLSYYQTLYDFYENAKDEQGNKVIELDKDKQRFLDAQIGLLESDLEQGKKNVEYIRGLMQDPDTALRIAEAGVTLNDTPEQVATKLADQGYRDERTALINKFTSDGYQVMASEAEARSHPLWQVSSAVDARGNTVWFWKPEEPEKPKSGTDKPKVDTNAVYQNLAEVRIPLTASNKDGTMTKSALTKVVDAGVPLNIALAIWQNIVDGATLEEIRQGMVNEVGLDKDEAYGWLDAMVQALQS